MLYVEELIGPRHGEHDAGGDDRGLPGSRRGRGDTLTRGRRRGPPAARAARGASGVDYDDVVATLEQRGRAEVRRLVRRAARRHRARSAASSSPRREPRTLVERIWERDPPSGPAATRRSWLGWLDEPARMRGAASTTVRRSPSRARRRRRRRPARHGRLEPRARGAAAHASAPMASTSSTRRIRRRSGARGAARPRAHALHRRLEVGHDARDALAPRLLLGADRRRGDHFAAITDPGSELERARRGARLPPRLPRRADDRRPLLGALAVRDRAGGADGRRRRAAARARGGDARRPAAPTRATPGSSSGARFGAGWQEGRDKVCITARRRLRALGRAADRGVDRQARQGARPRAGRVARRARPAGCRAAAARPVRARRGVLPLGVRDRGRRLGPRDQPVRPARRAGGEGQDERGARARQASPTLEPEGSLDELLAQAQERRLRLRPGVRRPEREPSSSRSSTGCAARAAASSRTGSARATCTRPASCTRAARTPACSSRSSTTPARRCRSPAAVRLRAADRGAGGGRLRVAEGARPPGRAGPDWRTSDEARDGRARPDGRGHDRAPARGRPRGPDVRPERRGHRVVARGARPAARGAAVGLDDGPGRRDHRGRRSSELLRACRRATRSSTAATRTYATTCAARASSAARGIHFVDVGVSGGDLGAASAASA